MIVKNKIKYEDIIDFFSFETITLDKAIGTIDYSFADQTISFDELSLQIFGLTNLKHNIKYDIHDSEIPTKLRHQLLNVEVDPFDMKSSFTYDETIMKEIYCKLDKIDTHLIVHTISMAIILESEKQLMHLNKVLNATNNIFTVATWWTDYDQYHDHFYQTPSGVRLLGVEEKKDRLYSINEFQRVREKAAKKNPYFEECITEEQNAYERVRRNEVDYFGGRTPAFTKNNEEVWVEAYGKCVLRYPDGSPRFFVAIDIYLSDLFEKSNQIVLLNSLLNQGFISSNVGIWYYVKQYKVGHYEFTESFRSLMKIPYELTDQNVREKIIQHFAAITEHK